MAVSTRTIKRRIRSVKNTKKITKAMELVAASKMRKAVEAAVNTRTYALMARDLLTHLAGGVNVHHPLLAVRPVARELVVMITSNRGLCGALNTNVMKRVEQHSAAHPGVTIELIALGRKGERFARRKGLAMPASFDKLPDTPGLNDVLPIARIILEEFSAGHYDAVTIAYTDFISAIAQKPQIRRILPVTPANVSVLLDETGKGVEVAKNGTQAASVSAGLAPNFSDFLFEPSRAEVLDTVLPRLVETQVYQAVLESAASEHSARMLAMRSASDAASEMIDDLTFTFNQARQAGITRELAEISAGAAALEE